MDENPLIAQRKRELLNYVQNFYRASWNWRSQRFHENWDRWDRNYHSIYDPEKASQKEPWQSMMFIGVTVQNVELITSQIFKTMMAPNPPIQVAAGPAGDELQARLIQETLAYQFNKALFSVNFYDVLKEAVRYGSGFIKMFWERKYDTRTRKTPLTQSPEQMVEGLPPEVLSGQLPMRYPGITGFQNQKMQVLLKNNLCARYVHIRDIFPAPNTRDWKQVIHRDKISYGEIVNEINRGGFFDVREELENTVEGENFEQDIRSIKQELGYFEAHREEAKHEKKHTVWELYSDLPRKWTQFDIPEGDRAEELVPSKVQVASGVALLSSEENPFFDAESPILKMGYIRTGDTYDKGICQLIEDEQEEINEIRNQRVDNVNLIMDKMIVVMETALYNFEDLEWKPGGVIRIKQTVVDDIRKAIMPIELPDVTASAYRETLEIERGIQERTGANRVTLGSPGIVKDTNQTLGGMELLRQMFNERVAAYGMVMEAAFLLRIAEKAYSLIYQELKPEDMRYILGTDPVEIAKNPVTGDPIEIPRFLAFAFVPPEEVNRAYLFKPMGIFSLENKIVKSAQVMDLIKLGSSVDPLRFNSLEALKYAAVNLQGIDEAEKWFKDVPMIPLTAIPPEILPMVMGGGGPPMRPPVKGTPGMKGGPQGNQPSFLPPNPVRREPVAG